MTGSVDLVGVETSQSETGGDWAPVSLDPGAAGWTWTREDAERSTVYRPPAGSPGRLQAGLGDEESGPLLGLVDRPGAMFRLTADPTGDGTLAAIAGDQLLALTGAHVGDTIAVDSAAQSLTVRIVGSVGEFPPLDPNGAFLVVDGTSLDLVSFATSGSASGPTEWLARGRRSTGRRRSPRPCRTRPYSASPRSSGGPSSAAALADGPDLARHRRRARSRGARRGRLRRRSGSRSGRPSRPASASVSSPSSARSACRAASCRCG